MTVKVVDRCGKEQQRTDGPAIFADSLANSLRVDGLVQIHGITLLLDYGDDLSGLSEINCVLDRGPTQLVPVVQCSNAGFRARRSIAQRLELDT
ncbi:hypothetical protein D3C76_1121330 [compost metagenome]